MSPGAEGALLTHAIRVPSRLTLNADVPVKTIGRRSATPVDGFTENRYSLVPFPTPNSNFDPSPDHQNFEAPPKTSPSSPSVTYRIGPPPDATTPICRSLK